MEEYLLDSVHLPIGCTDETTPLGKYWTFNDEIYISDPCPPLMDRIGIQDWAIVGGCPECMGRFTGNLREAMERYNQSKMSEARMMIDEAFKGILSGKDESNDVPRTKVPCRLIADSFPDLVFMFLNGFLEVYGGDAIILRMPVSKMDHFSKKV